MKAAHVGAAAGKVRAARIEAIRRIQSLAREKRVDFVLIAGDTFEHDGIGKPIIDSILDLLGGFDSELYLIPAITIRGCLAVSGSTQAAAVVEAFTF